MAETQTPNYHWTKPDIGGDASTWGNVLNTTFDAIDSVVFANQQAGAPIGSVIMWGGLSTALPSNWLLCDGAVYLDTDVPSLAPVLKAGGSTGFPGSDASHTAVPNLNGRFPVGGGGAYARGAMGGEATHILLVNELPAHAHTATQVAHTHTISQPAHTHPITDVAHNHGVNQWAHSHAIATGSHSHSISTGGHAHSSVLVSSGVTGASPPAGVGLVGNVGNTSTFGDLGGSTSSFGNLGGNTDGPTSAISLIASGTNLSVTVAAGNEAPSAVSATPAVTVNASTGGDGAANNLPPYTCVFFLIRFK